MTPALKSRSPGPLSADRYADDRRYVLRVLARRCAWLASDEREEVFQDAVTVLLEKQLAGALEGIEDSPPQLRAYLTQTAINKALDEGKRAGRHRSVALEDAELTVEDGKRAPDDLAAASLDSARVREIVSELPERRQAIIKLRFFFDRSPNEIQRFLGITERAYRRELERALRHLTDRYQMVEDGSFCEDRRSLILAFVAGIAGPGRNEAARAHLASCPGCARMAAELRELTRGAAVVVPLPVVLDLAPLGNRLLSALDAIREAIADALAWVKQQLSWLAARLDAGSSGYAAGARPGAMLATVAGCLAIGAGGAYCVIEGPPLISGGSEPRAEAREQPPAEPVSETVQAPPPRDSAPPASPAGAAKKKRTERKPKPKPEPKRETKVQSSQSAPAPETGEAEAAAEPVTEFGFEEAAPSAEPAPSAPAPSPPPPSEFGP